jgi:hypothetical protein
VAYLATSPFGADCGKDELKGRGLEAMTVWAGGDGC